MVLVERERTYLHMVLGNPSTRICESDRSIFFTRVGEGFIPDATTPEEAQQFMTAGLEFGTVNGNSIDHLQDLFQHVSTFAVFTLTTCVSDAWVLVLSLALSVAIILCP